MAVPLNLIPLPGSALASPSAPCLGPLPPFEQADAVLRLRRPGRHDDVTAVLRFVLDRGLRVLDVNRRAGTVDVRGSVLALGSAFGVQLRSYAGSEGSFRARRGMVHVPVTLVGILVGVDGLDQRPARPERLPSAPRPQPLHGPRRSPSSFPAAPRARAGRARVEPAGQAGSPVPSSVAGEDHEGVVSAGCDGIAAPASLAVVLQLPVRPAPAPPDHFRDDAEVRPVPLAPARARRRGPLVAAAAAQRDRRLARRLHPAGVDGS